jgi:hypothetical protein
VFQDDSLFDRLVRETSMIFFYNVMNAPAASPHLPGVMACACGLPTGCDAAAHDWGFRHCFGLNHSVCTEALREAGGYTTFPATYGYEDVEAAWRLGERFGMPVLYRPRASAEHDHRYSPRDYLEREEKLGYAAWGFAHQSPSCARELFGRDITGEGEIGYCREFVAREAKTADRLRATLVSLASIPAGAVAGDQAAALINALYEQHLLLKRWMWRRGLARAAAEAAALTGAASWGTAERRGWTAGS